MKKTVTFEYQINVFDVGAKVLLTSGRPGLPDGVYTVERCREPMMPGDNSTLYLRSESGEESVVSGEYFTEDHSTVVEQPPERYEQAFDAAEIGYANAHFEAEHLRDGLEETHDQVFRTYRVGSIYYVSFPFDWDD